MLKNINPLLNADVLYALRAMGHAKALVKPQRACRSSDAKTGVLVSSFVKIAP